MGDYPKRGDIYWVRLDPAEGSEIKKTRPCIILSNNVQNRKKMRLIIAPITTNTSRIFPFESLVTIKERECKALLDQIRCVDHSRIGKYVTSLEKEDLLKVEAALKVSLDLN